MRCVSGDGYTSSAVFVRIACRKQWVGKGVARGTGENGADGEETTRLWKASEVGARWPGREREKKIGRGKWRGVDKVRINIQSH